MRGPVLLFEKRAGNRLHAPASGYAPGAGRNIGLGRAERDEVVRIGLLLGDEVQFKPDPSGSMCHRAHKNAPLRRQLDGI